MVYTKIFHCCKGKGVFEYTLQDIENKIKHVIPKQTTNNRSLYKVCFYFNWLNYIHSNTCHISIALYQHRKKTPFAFADRQSKVSFHIPHFVVTLLHYCFLSFDMYIINHNYAIFTITAVNTYVWLSHNRRSTWTPFQRGGGFLTSDFGVKSQPPLRDPYSAGIDFSCQNLTSVDVRFWRLMSIPAL